MALLDKEKEAQQEALGIVGVNLVYGAAFLHGDPEALLRSLLDDLRADQLEIDGYAAFVGTDDDAPAGGALADLFG